MKKVLLILMLGVFSLSLSSYKTSDAITICNEDDSFDPCQDYAAGRWQAAVNKGYSNDEALQVFYMQYDFCTRILKLN